MRLFLAFEIPELLKERLAAEAGRLARLHRGWRWVDPEALHVTLRFLGEVEPLRLDTHAPAWRLASAPHAAIDARLAGAGVFPSAGRPRVLFAGLHEIDGGGRLPALAADLETAARSLGFEPEDRPFRSHVTLARATRGSRPSIPDPAALGELGTLRFDRVVLFESTLHASGARYRAIGTFPLTGGPGLRG